MYEVTPITSNVLSYLPESMKTNAPTAFYSFGLSNGYSPDPIPSISTPNPNLNPYMAKFLEKMGVYTPDSLYNRTKDTFNGAKNGFKDLGFDQKASTLIGGLGTVYGLYNAHQQLKLAKQQMAHNQMESERNYQAQRKMTNSQLEDRQKRRVEEAQANGRSTTSVADYMAKYGV